MKRKCVMIMCLTCLMLTACGETKVAKASMTAQGKGIIEATKNVSNSALENDSEDAVEEESDSALIGEYGVAE